LFILVWCANHPQIAYRDAQKMASEEWHKSRGTTKATKARRTEAPIVSSSSAQGSGRDWQMNPLLRQQLGGAWDEEQYKEFDQYGGDYDYDYDYDQY